MFIEKGVASAETKQNKINSFLVYLYYDVSIKYCF